MFQKHGFEPAFAGVTQEDKYAKVSNSKRYESVSFNSSETDDFNSFSSGDSSRQQKKASRPPKNKRKNNPKKKSLRKSLKKHRLNPKKKKKIMI